MEYVFKSVTKVKRNFIVNLLNNEIKDELKTKGYKFKFALVGSVKRNLVLGTTKKTGFDLDYRLYLSKKNKKKSLMQTKLDFKDAIDNALVKEGYKNAEDSTHVIEVKFLNESNQIDHGFDFGIINRIDSSKKGYILKNNKSGNQKEEDYVWEKLASSGEFNVDYKKIIGIEMWKELRKRYKTLREDDKIDKETNLEKPKDDRQISFSLLKGAVNDTLQSFDKK